MSYLRTSDLARAVDAHPNTVRRYVDRGILPPVERSPSGYRRLHPAPSRLYARRARSIATSISAQPSSSLACASSRQPSAATCAARGNSPTTIWPSCAPNTSRPTRRCATRTLAFGPPARGRRSAAPDRTGSSLTRRSLIVWSTRTADGLIRHPARPHDGYRAGYRTQKIRPVYASSACFVARQATTPSSSTWGASITSRT